VTYLRAFSAQTATLNAERAFIQLEARRQQAGVDLCARGGARRGVRRRGDVQAST